MLKYQELINEQQLTISCPPSNCVPNGELKAARWVISPLENNLNFLPNHVYNSQRTSPLRNMDEKLRCGFCSISLHTSIEASKTHFNSLTPAAKAKLGYTHVAEGIITSGTGMITPVSEVNKHFELFEFDGFNWIENFTIIEKLS
jgi:hypothetical protein